MVLPKSAHQKALAANMKHYPAVFQEGHFFRRGGHTLTGVVNFNGTPLFGKYVDFRQKKFTSRLRYYFMPSRGLWAAFIADILKKNGIPTPEVLGSGETRQHGGLLCESYIFTELLKVTDGEAFLRETRNDAAQFLTRARRLMQGLKVLHDAHVSHDDLKLDNLYLSDGKVGFWDLDSALYWPLMLPSRVRIRNVARLIVSILSAWKEMPPPNGLNPTPSELTTLCCRAYGDIDESAVQKQVRDWFHDRL